MRERLAGSPLAIRPAEWGRGSDRLVLSEIEALAVAARAVLAGAPAYRHGRGPATELADAPPRSADFAELITKATAARTALANSAPPDGSADAMRLGTATAALATVQSAGTDEAKLAALATAVAALAGQTYPSCRSCRRSKRPAARTSWRRPSRIRRTPAGCARGWRDGRASGPAPAVTPQ